MKLQVYLRLAASISQVLSHTGKQLGKPHTRHIKGWHYLSAQGHARIKGTAPFIYKESTQQDINKTVKKEDVYIEITEENRPKVPVSVVVT